MGTVVVGVKGVGGVRSRHREGSERWCLKTAIQTAMPPAAAMATWLSVMHARRTKEMQAYSRIETLPGCVFMTASMACW